MRADAFGLAAMVGAVVLGCGVPDARAQTPEKPTTTVTFARAIDLALTRNPTTERIDAEVARVEARGRQTRAGWLPRIQGNGNVTWLDDERRLGDRVLTPQRMVGANLQVTVPLIAPAAWLASARSRREVGVARAGREEVRREVALAAARLYVGVLLQRQVLEVAESARATAQAHHVFALRRLEGGTGNRIDALRAERELHDNEARVALARLQLIAAREALGVVLAEPGEVDAAGEVALPATPPVMDALARLPARPDIAELTLRLRNAEREVRDRWADYAPVLSAFAQPFFQQPATPTIPRTGWQAGLALELPLYDGGAREGAHAEQRAIARQARASLQETTLQAQAEVREGAAAVHERRRIVDRTEASRKAAEETFRLTRRAYEAGATSNLELIDAERAARDAANALLVARSELTTVELELLAAAALFPARS